MRLTPKKAGYITAVGPGRTIEADTITCGHCGTVVVVRSSDPDAVVDPGGGCRMCSHAICGPCADKGGCTPFLAKIERQLERSRFLANL